MSFTFTLFSNEWEVASALLSFFCSIVLIGIMAANIQNIDDDWYCVYQFVRKDHCKYQTFRNNHCNCV